MTAFVVTMVVLQVLAALITFVEINKGQNKWFELFLHTAVIVWGVVVLMNGK